MAKTTKSKGTRQHRSTRANPAEQRKWDDRLKQLKAYKRSHGNCDVPQRYAANPQLGTWVQTQRQYYKLGELSEDRAELLEELGFQWVVKRGPRGLDLRREEFEDEDLVESEESGTQRSDDFP